MLADQISVTSSQWSNERSMILHLILTTLAGEKIRLTLELQEYDRLYEFENAVMAQLPKLGESSTFGCSLSFVCRDTQEKLADPIWRTLRDHNSFTVISCPCFEEAEHKGQLQGDAIAIRVPYRTTDRVLPLAFAYVREGRHVQLDEGLRIIGEAAWRNCHQLQIVHLASTVICLQKRVFRRCFALRTVVAPGCKQFGIQAFEECCSLIHVGVSIDGINQLAPQAELMVQAFQKCTALQHIDMERTEYNPARPTRILPERCFFEAGLTSLALPRDFTWIGPAAGECCRQLQRVDLSRSRVTEIMGAAFAQCKNLQHLILPPNLRKIEQEAFHKCTSLTEVIVPPTLLYIARLAFAGCTSLSNFQREGKCKTWRGTYSRGNAFLDCDNLDKPSWIRWLPPNWKDEDNRANDGYVPFSSFEEP